MPNIYPYRDLVEIGRGGMATVYRATAPNGNLVALKVLAVHLALDQTARMRFEQEAGLGFRVGVGGFSLSDGFGSHSGVLSVPVGLNYLIGKDQKNYSEVGAGFTYINGSSKDDFSSENFSTSFGNLTLGYRLAPAKGGFFFKAQITPVFGSGFFIPYFGGIAFGYKF